MTVFKFKYIKLNYLKKDEEIRDRGNNFIYQLKISDQSVKNHYKNSSENGC